MREYPYERVLRDARILLIFEVSDFKMVKYIKDQSNPTSENVALASKCSKKLTLLFAYG